MKNINLIRSFATALVLLVGFAVAATGCSNDDNADNAVVKEGVVFRFQRKTVYKTGVNEIGSVKITLTKGSEKIILPSSLLKGSEDLVESQPFSLTAGTYAITAYTAYDRSQNWLFDMELDSKNEFTVAANNLTTFTVPVKTREVLNQNFIRSALMGLCLEIFGEDRSEWPWDPNKYPYPDWEGLEFEFDDYNQPMYITGITFDGMRDGKETPWVKMTELPYGTVANLPTLINLHFVDLPNLKRLSDDLNMLSTLGSIACINTGLEELPENLDQLVSLNEVVVVDGKLTSFPEDISKLTVLNNLVLRGNSIKEFNTPLTAQKRFISFDLSNNPLTRIGEGVFTADGTLNYINLSGTKLSALPAVVKNMTKLRAIDLTGCEFTSVPEQVKGNANLKNVLLGNNKLTSVAASDFSALTSLEDLFLAGNKLSSLPRLTNNTLLMLDVDNCGLSSTPDLSGLTNLRILYIGANQFTTLPANYFAANPKMRVLSLANSPALTSMPAGNLGLISKIAEKEEGFKLLNVENCPALTWQTPAIWQCYDFTGKTPDVLTQNAPSTRRPDIGPGDIYDEYFGRVGVKRQGSPMVTFGK